MKLSFLSLSKEQTITSNWIVLVVAHHHPLPEPQNLLFTIHAMGKRKATCSGLKGVELIDTLRALNELQSVVIWEQTLKQEAKVMHESEHRMSPPKQLSDSRFLLGRLLQSSAFELIEQEAPNGLCVIEAKPDGKQLADHLKQSLKCTGPRSFLGNTG